MLELVIGITAVTTVVTGAAGLGKLLPQKMRDKMMQILQRDFPDNQIIIASIYHSVQNEHVITLEGQLLDQMIEA